MNYSMSRPRCLNRIVRVFSRMKSSLLVREHDISEDSLCEFEDLLNDSSPRGNEEFRLFEFYRYLYKNTNYRYVRTLTSGKKDYLVLWTDHRNVARFFQIDDIVIIRRLNKRFKIFINTEHMSLPQQPHTSPQESNPEPPDVQESKEPIPKEPSPEEPESKEPESKEPETNSKETYLKKLLKK
jgi:hypothetical protein